MRGRAASVFAVFLTVFIDLLAFGLAISDIQLRGEKLGATGIWLGLVLSSYSIAQFAVAPFLGRLSDRVGRRPVLLITTAMAVVSFVVYAHVNTLPLMFLTRILQGLAGANIGVAYAYIADITPPQDRAKSMGLIGAAFGLGFLLGVPTGAVLVEAGKGSPLLMGYVAAALCLVNFLYILFALPESRQPGQAVNRESAIEGAKRAFRTPGLNLLLGMFFVANFGFANLESTFFRLVDTQFKMTQTQGALVLFWVGFVSAFMQGYLIRILQPRFGEAKLLRAGFTLQVPMLALVPFAPPWIPLLGGAGVLSVGGGMVQPSMSSLISRNTPADMQGSIFGVTQALGAMARILAPLVGNSLFEIQPWVPYAFAASIVAIPLVISSMVKIPEGAGSTESAAPLH